MRAHVKLSVEVHPDKYGKVCRIYMALWAIVLLVAFIKWGV
jgi:hypothetical protein